MIRWRYIYLSTACGAIAACGSDTGSRAPAADTVPSPAAPVQPQPTTSSPPSPAPLPGGTPTSGGPGAPAPDTGGLQVLPSRSATVRWRPPTANTNGSPLTDLSGFEVVYGTSPTDLRHEVQVPNPAILSVVIDDLEAGTWYFAARAYNARGIHSPLSNVAAKTIQ